MLKDITHMYFHFSVVIQIPHQQSANIYWKIIVIYGLNTHFEIHLVKSDLSLPQNATEPSDKEEGFKLKWGNYDTPSLLWVLFMSVREAETKDQSEKMSICKPSGESPEDSDDSLILYFKIAEFVTW